MDDDTLKLVVSILDVKQLSTIWDSLDDIKKEKFFGLLTDDQLLKLRDEGAMDQITMQIFKTEMFKRCLIDMDEAMGAFIGW